MKPSEALASHREEVREIIFSHKMINPRVFGSVADGTDTEFSDLDILVDPIAGASLFDLAEIEIALQKLLQIKIDILTPKFISKRYRDDVLSEALPL